MSTCPEFGYVKNVAVKVLDLLGDEDVSAALSELDSFSDLKDWFDSNMDTLYENGLVTKTVWMEQSVTLMTVLGVINILFGIVLLASSGVSIYMGVTYAGISSSSGHAKSKSSKSSSSSSSSSSSKKKKHKDHDEV